MSVLQRPQCSGEVLLLYLNKDQCQNIHPVDFTGLFVKTHQMSDNKLFLTAGLVIYERVLPFHILFLYRNLRK